MVMMLAAISSNPLEVRFGFQISTIEIVHEQDACKVEPDNDVEVQVARDEAARVEGEAVVDKAVGEEEIVPAHHSNHSE